MQAPLSMIPFLAEGWFTPSSLSMIAAAGLIVSGKLIEWFEKNKKDTATQKAGDPKAVRETSRVDEEIAALLQELRVHTGACRITLYLFHNGDKFYNNGPMQKLSCEYEVVKAGTVRITPDHRGISVSNLSAFLDLMHEDTPLINRTDKIKNDYCRTLLEDLAVTHFSTVPLENKSERIIGMLMVHWYGENNEKVSTKVYQDWFKGEMVRVIHNIQFKLMKRLEISGTHPEY